MALHIVTDSSADLPKNIIEEFNLDVLPLSVTIDDEDYLDGITITDKELMDRMRAGAITKTSQVKYSAFTNLFEKYVEKGDSVIYIGLASALSGTFNAANLAMEELREKYPNLDITMFDTKCVSMGLGMLVYKALVMQRDNATKEEIIRMTKLNAENMEHIFTVDNLEYLFRGGRISRAAALVGGLLGIKPVLEVTNEGTLAPLEKARGRKNSIKRMAEIACERGKDLDKQIIGISHGDDMEAVEFLIECLKDTCGCKEFIVNGIGCVVGAHAGPGTLAVFFSRDTNSR